MPLDSKDQEKMQDGSPEVTYQWQKSEDTTVKVSSLDKYGARSFPNVLSLSLFIAPTRIGMILISILQEQQEGGC